MATATVPVKGQFAAPGALALVVIDPMFDFMHEAGAFATHLGIEKTKPVRDVAPVLTAAVRAFNAYGCVGCVGVVGTRLC